MRRVKAKDVFFVLLRATGVKVKRRLCRVGGAAEVFVLGHFFLGNVVQRLWGSGMFLLGLH